MLSDKSRTPSPGEQSDKNRLTRHDTPEHRLHGITFDRQIPNSIVEKGENLIKSIPTSFKSYPDRNKLWKSINQQKYRLILEENSTASEASRVLQELEHIVHDNADIEKYCQQENTQKILKRNNKLQCAIDYIIKTIGITEFISSEDTSRIKCEKSEIEKIHELNKFINEYLQAKEDNLKKKAKKSELAFNYINKNHIQDAIDILSKLINVNRSQQGTISDNITKAAYENKEAQYTTARKAIQEFQEAFENRHASPNAMKFAENSWINIINNKEEFTKTFAAYIEEKSHSAGNIPYSDQIMLNASQSFEENTTPRDTPEIDTEKLKTTLRGPNGLKYQDISSFNYFLNSKNNLLEHIRVLSYFLIDQVPRPIDRARIKERDISGDKPLISLAKIIDSTNKSKHEGAKLIVEKINKVLHNNNIDKAKFLEKFLRQDTNQDN